MRKSKREIFEIPLPATLVYTTALTCGMLAAIAMQIQLNRAGFDLIGPWVGSNREVFETNLMRDAHPTREIDLWLRMAAAWQKYHVLYLASQVQAEEDESKLVGTLVAISLGCGPQDLKNVTPAGVLSPVGFTGSFSMP